MKIIEMSGEVGWDFTARDVERSLKEANGEDVQLNISSPGGLVSDALRIFNLVRNYAGHTTAILSGFAMSAASYIPLAADKVIAEDNAVYMIHNVHGGVWGDHNDILHYGTMCKGLSLMFTNAYAKFTGKTTEELSALMDATTFYYGDQIAEAGFAHEMAESTNDIDIESAMATAKLAHQETTAKLVNDQTALKKDLDQAAVLALGEYTPRAIKPTNKKEPIMDLATLKKDHADLVALIADEAKAGHEEAITTAKAEGAATEMARIQAVKSQSLPGFEHIVEAAMFDGKSQAGDVAMQIVAANKLALDTHKADNSADAPPVVPEPSNNMELDANCPLTEDKAKAAWGKMSASAQNEYAGDMDVYLAYVMPDSGVKIKTINNRGK